jgi:hypothetical protein
MTCGGMKIEQEENRLALVAIGALLGVEIFRRNTEHVVTLNANAMKSRLSRRRSLMFCSVRLGLRGFCAHGEILAHPSGNSIVRVWLSARRQARVN